MRRKHLFGRREEACAPRAWSGLQVGRKGSEAADMRVREYAAIFAAITALARPKLRTAMRVMIFLPILYCNNYCISSALSIFNAKTAA